MEYLSDALKVAEIGDCRMYLSLLPRKELSNHANP